MFSSIMRKIRSEAIASAFIFHALDHFLVFITFNRSDASIFDLILGRKKSIITICFTFIIYWVKKSSQIDRFMHGCLINRLTISMLVTVIVNIYLDSGNPFLSFSESFFFFFFPLFRAWTFSPHRNSSLINQDFFTSHALFQSTFLFLSLSLAISAFVLKKRKVTE